MIFRHRERRYDDIPASRAAIRWSGNCSSNKRFSISPWLFYCNPDGLTWFISCTWNESSNDTKASQEVISIACRISFGFIWNRITLSLAVQTEQQSKRTVLTDTCGANSFVSLAADSVLIRASLTIKHRSLVVLSLVRLHYSKHV